MTPCNSVLLTSLPLRSQQGALLLAVLFPPSTVSFLSVHPAPPWQTVIPTPLDASSHPAQHTCQDRLVHPERGGLDGKDADIGWDLVPHCGQSREGGQLGKDVSSFLRKTRSLANNLTSILQVLGRSPGLGASLHPGLESGPHMCSCRPSKHLPLNIHPIVPLLVSFCPHWAMSPVRGGTGTLPGT